MGPPCGYVRMDSRVQLERDPIHQETKYLDNMKQAKKKATKRNKGQTKSQNQNTTATTRSEVARTNYPKASVDNRGTRRIRQTEQICTVIGTGENNWDPLVFPLNPALKDTFPWGGDQAKYYQFYTARAMSFSYHPRCPTTTTGSVYLFPEYESSDHIPESPKEASRNVGCAEDAVWKPISVKLDPRSMHPTGPRKYTRHTVRSGDLNNFDVGKIVIGTDGVPDGVKVGTLWCTYDIELSVPQQEQSQLDQSSNCLALTNVSGNQFLPTGTNTALQWAKFLCNGLRAPLPLAASDYNYVTLKPGTYEVEVTFSFENTGLIVGFLDVGVQINDDWYGDHLYLREYLNGLATETKNCNFRDIISISETSDLSIVVTTSNTIVGNTLVRDRTAVLQITAL